MTKKQLNLYKDLKKIKNPVLIYVEYYYSTDKGYNDSSNRFRILYPNGYCQYSVINSYSGCFYNSCFLLKNNAKFYFNNKNKFNLHDTVNSMLKFDKMYDLVIKDFINI